MSVQTVIAQAQEYMAGHDLSGWLLYDYRGMNPIFWDTVGPVANVTRPCWLWIPVSGTPRLLVAYVDQGRFGRLGLDTTLFAGREDMTANLTDMLAGDLRIAMEYSPDGLLPRVSKVDAGTLEFVRGLGVKVVSSADLLQYATQRWNDEQLRSHQVAADTLGVIVMEAFQRIGETLASGPTEHDIAQFIRRRFVEEGLEVTDGPVVAVNAHAADPHFEPTADNCSVIMPGDWVLIDLWARQPGQDAMFGDITWTAYVGDHVPQRHQQVFDAVIGGRDAAVRLLEEAFHQEREIQGWELDRVARDYISNLGFGDYFNHRLGHSLGREVHSNAVNLDSWETYDTRVLMPGIAVTIEPGIYLPGEFGVRSEIDVFIAEDGPRITTAIQREVVMIRG